MEPKRGFGTSAQTKSIHENLDKRAFVAANRTFNAKAITPEAKQILRNGYIILHDIVSKDEIHHIRNELNEIGTLEDFGRNNFEGVKTKRIYSLPAKTRCTDILIQHPKVIEILDQLLQPNYLLSAMQAINIFPGESLQPYHQDDGFTGIANPHPHLSIGTIWALTDFTSSNGATELIPGSHMWDTPPTREDVLTKSVKSVMKAGSVVVFLSTIWHGGGANKSTDQVREAVTFQYCQPWARPQENILLGFDPQEIKKLSPNLQSMLGMSIHPPFIGHYNGQHPTKSPWAVRGKL